MSLSVWIILLNHNNTEDTLECLDSLRQADCANLHVLVVDNGSSVNPADALRAHYPTVEIIENKVNAGFAEGNNIGLRYALDHGADYLFVLNNDTFAPKDLVKRLVSLSESDPSIGMVCPAIVSYHDRSKRFVPFIDWHWGVGGEWPLSPSESALRDVDYATGCAQLVKAHIAREIGLYDPDYFIYYEDADWSQRCKLAGYRVVMDPSSVLYHKGTPDRAGQKWSNSWYYYLRNQPLFFRRYGKPHRARAISIRHSRFCLTEFRKALIEGNEAKAGAVLGGWLAGVLRVYGAQRITMPAWLMWGWLPVGWLTLKIMDISEFLAVKFNEHLSHLRSRFPMRTTLRRLLKRT